MDDRKNTEACTQNLPHGARVNGKDLDAMSAVELAEEMELLWGKMDEDTYDGALLDAYLDALDRKAPMPEHMDTETAYRLFLERSGKMGKRRFRGALKVCLIAAAMVALLVASIAAVQATGFDLFGRIARWTAETFGFETAAETGSKETDIPPQLEGMKAMLEERHFPADLLPTYWPEEYEQEQLLFSADSTQSDILGFYGNKENHIALSFTSYTSEKPEMVFSIDEETTEPYTHNKIEFYIMTNADKYIAAWTQGNIECVLSEVPSYEELIKILDSIGGSGK